MIGDILSKKIKVGQLDIRYLTGGRGEPLIVIHGGGGQGAQAWRNNLEELARNYTMYVPDLPGFGGSQPLSGDYFIPELTEFINDFSRELGLDKFYLMGHSLGGGIALDYALKFPHKIKKLVLVSSMCLGREIAFWVRFLSHRLLIGVLGGIALAAIRFVKWLAKSLYAPNEFVEPICQTSVYLGSSISTLKEQATVLMHRLSEIMVPTLVVWGAKDPVVPVRHAYAAAYLIPDCRVKVFADSGHSVYREKIKEFSRELMSFLG